MWAACRGLTHTLTWKHAAGGVQKSQLGCWVRQQGQAASNPIRLPLTSHPGRLYLTCPIFSFPHDSLAFFVTLGGASLSGRTQAGGLGLGPGPSEVGSEFWRMTAPRALGVVVGVVTAGSGSWEAGKAARFRVGWSCRDWDRGTGAAYGFSGTRCATRLCRERPGRVGCPLHGTSPPGC